MSCVIIRRDLRMEFLFISLVFVKREIVSFAYFFTLDFDLLHFFDFAKIFSFGC